MPLTREQFLKPVATRTVSTTEGDVLVRGLTTAQAMDLYSTPGAQDEEHVRLLLCVWGVVDEQGEPMLTVEDIDALKEMPSGTIQDIAEAVLDLSGLDVGQREELKKNSTTIATSDSCSN